MIAMILETSVDRLLERAEQLVLHYDIPAITTFAVTRLRQYYRQFSCHKEQARFFRDVVA